MALLQKITHKDVRIAVIGLGYVGLPLAVEFARAGFSVLGIDTDRRRLNNVKKGISYVEDVPSRVLYKLVNPAPAGAPDPCFGVPMPKHGSGAPKHGSGWTKHQKLVVTGDYSNLKNVDVIIICVPTPLRKTKEPDVSYVLAATRQIARYMDGPRLVILESTTYPGTTEELILPILSKNGKKVGRDFFLTYSPERVDPGNKKYGTVNIPKVIAGTTPSCLNLINSLYRHVFSRVVPVSSTRVAETIKLLENTFRTVNIALVDEIALMCHKMGIDVWEVIRGASTKPFGFMPFYPGPGLGGACLPKDPLYLAWRAKLYHDFRSRFIELASDITASMPRYVVDRIKVLLGKPLKHARLLLLGAAYKSDIGDTRDSPALEIIKILQQVGADVIYNDPYVPGVVVGRKRYRSVSITNQLLRNVDIVVITTAHTKYDFARIIKYAPLVFDTRGATWGIAKGKTSVSRL